MAEVEPDLHRVQRGIEQIHEFVARIDDRLTSDALSRDDVLELSEHLHNALEEVQTLYEAVCQQADHLASALSSAHAERERYRHLFEHAPHAYIVTDVHGVIREANPLASSLLNTPPEFLVGVPLASFVEQTDRPTFRRDFTRLTGLERVEEWQVSMRPHNAPAFQASLSVSVVPDHSGRVSVLRWMIRDITDRAQVATLWRMKFGRMHAQCSVAKTAAGLEVIVEKDGAPAQREVFPSWPEVMRQSTILRAALKTEGWI
jgi:PAS domain S-box-containing protein